MGWNYLSIPKLQRYNRWGSGIDKLLHPTFYNGWGHWWCKEPKSADDNDKIQTPATEPKAYDIKNNLEQFADLWLTPQMHDLFLF